MPLVYELLKLIIILQVPFVPSSQLIVTSLAVFAVLSSSVLSII